MSPEEARELLDSEKATKDTLSQSLCSSRAQTSRGKAFKNW